MFPLQCTAFVHGPISVNKTQEYTTLQVLLSVPGGQVKTQVENLSGRSVHQVIASSMIDIRREHLATSELTRLRYLIYLTPFYYHIHSISAFVASIIETLSCIQYSLIKLRLNHGALIDWASYESLRMNLKNSGC